MRTALALTGLFVMAACAPMTPAPGPAGPWQCDAEGARSLIGSHVGAVTFPQDANVRLVCTTCPMTRDYRPDRLTILFNEATGIIEEVRCV
ncbi:hypothetical protein [Brevundimonas sp.]|uniref:hypothetical protein n=1 Tax=Brevundimonas sp. TaxID=1871086 RepID=UPI0025CFFADF|nr:hypothetical protein [Brevundimonas sp.]